MKPAAIGIIKNPNDNSLRNIEMKNMKPTLVVLTLLGTMCLASGCDRFGDAAADGVFGLVADVVANLISAGLPPGLGS